jgi:hypothetical protein
VALHAFLSMLFVGPSLSRLAVPQHTAVTSRRQLRQEQPLDLARNATWNQLCETLPTEQLVYLAALVANVPVVYGDRSKV